MTAFWEVYATLLLPLAIADRKLSQTQLKSRRWVEVAVQPGLAMFDATAIKYVRDIGATNASFHGDWDRPGPGRGPGPWAPQLWGETLFRHAPHVDGILFTSDKDTPARNAAVFRRASTDGPAITGRFGPLLFDDTAFLAQLRKTDEFG